MNKHTPGPWTIGTATFDRERGAALQGKVPRLFMPGGVEVLIVSLGAEKEEIDADTRLISAAPDLLYALENLINMDVSYNRGPKVEDAVVAAKAAIEKAIGSI